MMLSALNVNLFLLFMTNSYEIIFFDPSEIDDASDVSEHIPQVSIASAISPPRNCRGRNIENIRVENPSATDNAL
ncbi:MAG: hypothetical protein A2096_14810 [Spirochaetes bacterium GWF1_41_5]|nr:MAG: hypothetical protein A2096_14810 [Spirochaetes bacterium GWF1_41_5]